MRISTWHGLADGVPVAWAGRPSDLPRADVGARFANGIVAVAEEKVITVADVQREIGPLIRGLQESAKNQQDFDQKLEQLEDSVIQELIDRVLIINQGRVVAQGTPADLRHEILGDSRYQLQLAGDTDALPALLTRLEPTLQIAERSEKIAAGLAQSITPNMVKAAKGLQWIQALTTGVDPLKAMKELDPNISITSGRGIHGPQMSELAFLYMLNFARDIRKIGRAHV